MGWPPPPDAASLADQLIAASSRSRGDALSEGAAGFSANTSRVGRPWTPVRGMSSSTMAPQLAYGRHRGPARRRSRRAAVAVCLFDDPATGWTIPLTRRPTTLRHHGGQICFPGGRIEPGETALQAAVREYEEELGLPADVLADCGQLPPQYVYASDHLVFPVVLILESPRSPWRLEPAEVDEVLSLPVALLLESPRIEITTQRRTLHRAGPAPAAPGPLAFGAPAYVCGGHHVWGATAIILDHLVQRLRGVERIQPDLSD